MLHTPRSTLIPFDRDDAPLFHAINTDPFVRKYLWDDEVISLRKAEEMIETNHRNFREQGFGLWKIVHPVYHEVVGYTGLWPFYEAPQPQLVYAITEAFSGQGLALECASRVKAYAFQELNFPYLIAAMDKQHVASRVVARRLGMQLAEVREENGKPTCFFRVNR